MHASISDPNNDLDDSKHPKTLNSDLGDHYVAAGWSVCKRHGEIPGPDLAQA